MGNLKICNDNLLGLITIFYKNQLIEILHVSIKISSEYTLATINQQISLKLKNVNTVSVKNIDTESQKNWDL